MKLTHYQQIGFSTGALEKGDFRKAVEWLITENIRCVELSSLRVHELEPLIHALPSLPLENFDYISLHAPSKFNAQEEEKITKLLEIPLEKGWNIIIHPDTIKNFNLWEKFQGQLLLENMDGRKPGRTIKELLPFFEQSKLPNANICLDIAHAEHLDPKLELLKKLIEYFDNKIQEVHISELDINSWHHPIKTTVKEKFQSIALPKVPVIIESMLYSLDFKARLEELNVVTSILHKS